MRKSLVFVTSIFLSVVLLSSSIAASFNNSKQTPHKVFEKFKPQPANDEHIDYEQVDQFLSAYVMVSGPSIRKRSKKPPKPTSSNMLFGHISPYRLEGNKLLFSQFDEGSEANIPQFVESMVEIANEYTITEFPKDEQLAFWFNLHNLLVIQEVNKRYPTRRPSDIQIDEQGTLLHDAKLVTINEVALSLSDIRTNIVYRYWQDPLVFYGFFHGDLASPSIRNKAYTGNSVFKDLTSNAKEFVNSLRGVENTFGPVKISPLYEEAQPYLFQNWPGDFKDHALTHASKEVKDILGESDELLFAKRQKRIADTAGGMSSIPYKITSITGNGISIDYNSLRFFREFYKKQDILLERTGKLGSVEVTDLPSGEEDAAKNEEQK